MPLILGRSGAQYVAMVTKLFSSHCVAPLVEPSSHINYLFMLQNGFNTTDAIFVIVPL